MKIIKVIILTIFFSISYICTTFFMKLFLDVVSGKEQSQKIYDCLLHPITLIIVGIFMLIVSFIFINKEK